MHSSQSCSLDKHDKSEHAGSSCSQTNVNVGEAERWISGAAGGALLLGGLARGRLEGLLAMLGGGALLYRAYSGHCSLYQALNINTAENGNPATAISAQQGVRIEHSIAIEVPAERLYRHWRVLSNLPKFIPLLESVRETDPAHSHWIANTPMGAQIAWDAEIIEDRHGELISWRSLPGSDIDTAGSVRFQRVGDLDQSILTLNLKYNPPGGKVAAHIAEFLGLGMQQQFEEALERFKEDVEAQHADQSASPRQTDTSPI